MSKKRASSGHRTRWMLLGLTVAGLALVAWWARLPAIEVATGVVDRGPVLEWVRSEGVFRARVHETVMAPADGDISRIALDEGDPVRAGQRVASIYWDQGFSVIRSPLDGVISVVHREVAGPVRRGEALLEVVDPSRLELRVELLTRDALRISPGARAVVSDIIGGARQAAAPELEARGERVSRAGFIKPSALGVEEERTAVFLAPVLDDASRPLLERVGDRFHAEVAIEIARRADVLRIPIGALQNSGDFDRERWQVHQIREGRIRLRAVRLGLVGESHAEMLGGLNAQDLVVMYPGEELREGGGRVR